MFSWLLGKASDRPHLVDGGDYGAAQSSYSTPQQRNANCEAYRTEQAVFAERDRCAKLAEEFICAENEGYAISAKIRSGE